jgi:signal transduction histidine kinase
MEAAKETAEAERRAWQEKLESTTEEMDTEKADREQRLMAAEERIESLKKETQDLNDKIEEAEEAREKAETESREWQEKLESATEEVDTDKADREERLKAAEEEIESLSHEIQDLNDKVEAAEEAREKAEAESQAWQEKLDSAAKEVDTDKEGREEHLKAAEEEIESLKKETQDLNDKLEAAEKAREKVETEKRKWQEKLESLAEEADVDIADREERLKAAKEEIESLKKENLDLNDKLEAAVKTGSREAGTQEPTQPAVPVDQADVPEEDPASPSPKMHVSKEKEGGSFQLGQLLDQVCERVKPGADEKGLELKQEMGEEVPEAWEGNPLSLKQILTHLAENAVNFTKQGEVLIRADKEEAVGSRVRLHFTIQDTGVGIPEDKQEALNAYLNDSPDAPEPGAIPVGMGLATAKKLLEKTVGRLWVESEEMKGSTFHLTLTLKALNQTSQPASEFHDSYGVLDLDGPAPKPDEALEPEEQPAPEAGGDPCLLLVEDENQSLDDLVILIKGLGLPMEKAADAREAQKVLREKRYNGVLVAVNLFLLGEVAELLSTRKDLKLEDMPIIGLVEGTSKEELDILLAMGITRCCSRPFDTGEMQEVLCKLIPQEVPAVGASDAGSD